MNSRKVIYEILVECIMHHGYANLLMRKKLNIFTEEDRRFATNIIYGVLRNYEWCALSFQSYLTKSCGKRLEILLVLGVYQLFFTNVPNYSAIAETVEIAKQQEKSFINAILRKVETNGLKDLSSLNDFEKARILSSIPLWIANMWKKQYGQMTALKIIEACKEQASVFGRFNTLKCDPKTIEDNNIEMIDDIGFKYHGLLQDSKYYHLGYATIQDYNSQQIVKLFNLKQGMKVLDGCAAPGSKTSQIAMMLNNTGTIDAVEPHLHRCELLKENCERLNIENVTVHSCSLLDMDLNENEYDAILLDAPCSGLGVLARRCEIRFHIQGENLDELQTLQASMLDKVASALKVNGQLVYSTCTLNKKENEKQIERFLSRFSNYRLVKEVTMLPNEIDNDCFYAALLEKKS